jgi:hypothetical protein
MMIKNKDLKTIVNLDLNADILKFNPKRWESLIEDSKEIPSILTKILIDKSNLEEISFESLLKGIGEINHSILRDYLFEICAKKAENLYHFSETIRLSQISESGKLKSDIKKMLIPKMENGNFSFEDFTKTSIFFPSEFNELEEVYIKKFMEKILNINDVIFIIKNDDYLATSVERGLLEKITQFNPTIEEWEIIFDACNYSGAKEIQKVAEQNLFIIIDYEKK